ncbi:MULTISPECIES: YdeI/OmpD-associated family protein [Clostridium]|uniref:YdeI/OmpD-associated family protein n=1 Tax=Clostridium TaxID=1485 RepID=UPI0009BDC07D|nr:MULTISPECIES: YdeI/OmpD-associated family protein [Clostridium]PJI07271.1 antitermination protein NusB [Clostridium sp. CT7]
MKQEFKAIIKQHGDKDAAYVEIPFDVNDVFGSKRVKVKATFNGVEYRGSIVRMSGCYMLGITKEIRNKIGKRFGEEIFITLEKDEEKRVVEVPEDFVAAINKNEIASNTFQSFSYTDKKRYVVWITSAKREATRNERIAKAVTLLSEGKKLK